MASSRYALVLNDGTIANIVALDVNDEKGVGFLNHITAKGYKLVLLKDSADEMGKVNVEPGDKCTDVSKSTFQKGTLGTTPVDFSVTKLK